MTHAKKKKTRQIDRKPLWGIYVIVISCLLLMWTACVYADEIILENGDRISGIVKRVDNGSLIVETDYSQQMNIKTSAVTTIVTVNPVEVHLTSGEVLKGRLITDESGRIIVSPGVEREPVAIDWNMVESINPPPVKWTGHVMVGGNSSEGNTDEVNVSSEFEATRRTKQDRFGLGFNYNYGEDDDEVTTRNASGFLKYDHFLSQHWYVYLATEMFYDRFDDLNLRAIVGPGLGYQVWDDTSKSLAFELGISYLSEDLREGDDDHWVNGRLSIPFMFKISEYLTFRDKPLFYLNLEETERYLIRNDASILTAIGASWSLRVSHIYKYDSEPSEDVRETDTTWIGALQYNF